MEPLQVRMLLAAVLEDGVLTVRGFLDQTDNDNSIHISSGRGEDGAATIDIRYSRSGEGEPRERFDAAGIRGILVLGGDGHDWISAGVAGDVEVTLRGGRGDDQIYARRKGHLAYGGTGSDHIESVGPLKSIEGGTGYDTIIANRGRRMLSGESRLEFRRNGTLLINGSNQDDLLYSHWDLSRPEKPEGVHIVEFDSLDLTDYFHSVKRIIADLGGGNDEFQTPQMNPIGSRRSRELAVTIFGGAGDDFLGGGVLDDSISGGSGDDEISPLDGRDTADGGSGNDLIHNHWDDDLVRGGSGHDRLVGGWGDDTILGDAGIDTMLGGFGMDRIEWWSRGRLLKTSLG
jgi:Ca2+-binding RTX toxin-like protein